MVQFYCYTLMELATFCTQSLFTSILQLYPLRICNFLYAKSIYFYTIVVPSQNLQLFVRKVYRVLYYSYTPIDFATFCTQSLFSTILQLYSHRFCNFLYAKSIEYYTIAIPPQILQLFVRKVYLVLYYSYTPIDFATFCTQSLQSSILQLYPHRICNFLYAKSIQYYTIAKPPEIGNFLYAKTIQYYTIHIPP